MSHWHGDVRKMRVGVDATNTAEYQMPVGDELVPISTLIGKKLSVSFEQAIHCVHCGRATKKSFNQGYCYPCLQKLAQCDTCIVRPETCHYDQGTCREPQWGEDNCMQDHFVYLANTGTIKVGITRHVHGTISSRWLDQGATQALPILRVKNRLVSGQVEMACKQFMADKTNWRTMLKGQPEAVDLAWHRDQLLDNIKADIETITDDHGLNAVSEVTTDAVDIQYPVEQYPVKIKSINLDKEGGFEGQLLGIKGQYLMLDGDRVINIRKYAGYQLSVGGEE